MSCDVSTAKVGDLVILEMRHHLPRPVRVDKVTATQVVCEGMRFRKRNGRKTGSDAWNWTAIHIPATGEIDECRASLRHYRLSRELKDFDFALLPSVALEQVSEIVQAHRPDKKPAPNPSPASRTSRDGRE